MSDEGGRGDWTIKASGTSRGEIREGKISGSVGVVETDRGWSVEMFDDEGVRVMPEEFNSFEEADAFAQGFIQGLDQGFQNAIIVLDKVRAIDKKNFQILPQVVRDGDDN